MVRVLVLGKALAGGQQSLYAALRQADDKEQGQQVTPSHRQSAST